jgi:hypothetical protein
MATIRPLERGDIPAVFGLVEANFEAFERDRRFFEAMLLDDPWTPDPPAALVALEGEEIVGFIGAQDRRMSLDGSEIRGVSVSQFVVTPPHRTGGTPMQLLRGLLSGPQDLTWAEGAPEPVARMWRVLGGDADHARDCDWMLVLRPSRWLSGVIGDASRRRISRHTIPVSALPTRALRARTLRREHEPSAGSVSAGDATPSEVVEALPALTRGYRLRISYDEAHLGHMLEQWGALSGIVCRLVRRHERTIGWYVYISKPGRVGRALHVAALERETGAVLADLVGDAVARGHTALSGRLEPHLSEALRDWGPAFGLGYRPVVHASEPELRAALGRTDSLLSEFGSIDSPWL